MVNEKVIISVKTPMGSFDGTKQTLDFISSLLADIQSYVIDSGNHTLLNDILVTRLCIDISTGGDM